MEEMKEIAPRLAATGLVDFFSILSGCAENYVNLAAVTPNMMFPSQPYVYLAAAIRAGRAWTSARWATNRCATFPISATT